jgi:hypothetical protein
MWNLSYEEVNVNMHTMKKVSINANIVVLAKLLTTVSALLLVSASTTAFAQEEQQNQTAATITSGNNNTNTTSVEAASTYNEMLNPRQVEYPAHLGFNDLHIEAIRHIDPNATQASATNQSGQQQQQQEDLFNVIVHHHCKVYDDMTAVCLLFPTGMDDQDKPYGIEFVIPTAMYNTLPEEEKRYWHYHLTELPRVNATLPDMTAEEAAAVKPILDETYGKVVYFWQYGDELPIGEPRAIIIEDIIEQAEGQRH